MVYLVRIAFIFTMEEPPQKRQRREDDASNNGDLSLEDSQAYIDTINRHKIDFDFEKICLVSLSKDNVYCCLVCGKYFQGRSVTSPAYNHSIEQNHHVFMNVNSHKTHILPENYQVKSTRALNYLEDIVYLLNPTYTQQGIAQLKTRRSSYGLNNKEYTVGYVGLNNISHNDYSNVILQALAHVEPIRDYLLLLPNESAYDIIAPKCSLVTTFGLLVRKIWSSKLFKPHVSPHEFLQLVSLMSKKKFTLIEQNSPKNLMVWLLNQFHSQLAKALGKKKTIFSKTFQGNILITTIPVAQKAASDGTVIQEVQDDNKKEVHLKFWYLTLTLGPPSALKQREGELVPQVSIELLLLKYDGKTTSQVSATELRTHKLKSPGPPYLIMHIDRNLDNGDVRGNLSVVTFPTVLDMAPYIDGSDDPQNYELVSCIKHHHVAGGAIDRKEDKQQWSISLLADKGKSEWINIHDLNVTQTDGELLFLDETYIQIWRRV